MSYFVLLLSAFVPSLVLVGFVLAWRYLFDRDRRRSPLNFKVLNLPGDSLRTVMAKHDAKMDEAGLMAMICGPLVLAAWAIARLKRNGEVLAWSAGDWLFLVFGLAIIGWAAYGFIKHGKLRRRYKQGMEAEIAVAQNLLPLMADGCMVFHDFPADGFNIDHIVVAPNAVFAIETKSRKKGKGRDSAKVTYNGRSLTYPQAGESKPVETKPIEQALRQAQWLTNFLSKAAGDPVTVIPVLALPGWFVELSKEGSRAEVIVNNCRSPGFLLKLARAPVAMDGSLFRRIGHALTERYPKGD
jgi:hypothetical protein